MPQLDCFMSAPTALRTSVLYTKEKKKSLFSPYNLMFTQNIFNFILILTRGINKVKLCVVQALFICIGYQFIWLDPKLELVP